MEPWTLAMLVAAGFVAAFIDSQVGGGGVITLPALLAAGLPPHLALGTNKLGGTAAAFVASANYLHKQAVPLRPLVTLAPLAFLGGAMGVALSLRTTGAYVLPLVLVVMGAMAAYVLLRPRFGADDHPRLGALPLAAMGAVALVVGSYDGLLGPGTGSMLLFAIVAILGFGFRQAAGLGRLLNLASNVSSLAFFAAMDLVDWSVGLPMAASMGIGGWVGSHATLRHGQRLLRPLFVAITAALMLRLAWLAI